MIAEVKEFYITRTSVTEEEVYIEAETLEDAITKAHEELEWEILRQEDKDLIIKEVGNA
tara:strand:- start:481 stop:657 length:177 start_codon:yes stop_codon:yes gene_type:complete